MFKEILLKTGLTPSQAEILDFLYRSGEARASEVARNIKRSRAIVYKELEELEKLGLVDKNERPNRAATFFAEHPSLLTRLMDDKKTLLEKERRSFIESLPNIVSSYNLIHDRPGIRFYEGVDGLGKIYSEILEAGKDFLMVRSAYEPVYKEKILPVVNEFIRKRVRRGMRVTAITPTDEIASPEKDAEWLMTRLAIKKSAYTAPVEISIFDDKVALLSFGAELIGVLIESRQIAESFKQVFELAGKNATAPAGKAGADDMVFDD